MATSFVILVMREIAQESRAGFSLRDGELVHLFAASRLRHENKLRRNQPCGVEKDLDLLPSLSVISCWVLLPLDSSHCAFFK